MDNKVNGGRESTTLGAGLARILVAGLARILVAGLARILVAGFARIQYVLNPGESSYDSFPRSALAQIHQLDRCLVFWDSAARINLVDEQAMLVCHRDAADDGPDDSDEPLVGAAKK